MGRVLVLGANGFIGAHVSAALSKAGWAVRAGARDPTTSARRAPDHEWVRADFFHLALPTDWEPLLKDVEAVVNCVGVLQDGGRDDTRIAHVDGPGVLIEACARYGVRRVVHLSAVGAEAASGAAYGRTKQQGERLFEASELDWIILRPSLVVARSVFGGTGLIRALAAFPGFIPAPGGDQRFRPVAMEDLCTAVIASLASGAPVRQAFDVAGPEGLTLEAILRLYRGWLGLKPAPVIAMPSVLIAPVVVLGDLAGKLGWSSPLRSTSVRQMNHNVEGDPDRWVVALGVKPRTLARTLSEAPSSVQDVWHARLWFVRPLSIVTLCLFWTLTGLISVGPGWERAIAILRDAGYGDSAAVVVGLGALLDMTLGLALLLRRWTAPTAILMALAAVGYLIAGTAGLPGYWLDPLGPWLKVLPMIVLCLFVAATDARR